MTGKLWYNRTSDRERKIEWKEGQIDEKKKRNPSAESAADSGAGIDSLWQLRREGGGCDAD